MGIWRREEGGRGGEQRMCSFPSINKAASIAERAGLSSLRESASRMAESDGEVLASGNMIDIQR